MFEQNYQYDHTGYDLILKQDSGWKDAKMRVLIVVQYLPSWDVRNGELLSIDDSMQCMTNICKLAQKWKSKYNASVINPKFKVFNFYAEKHFHLGTEQREEKELEFAKRLKSAIELYKPTHVLFCGNASYALISEKSNSLYRLGWVETLKVGSHKFYATQTFDLFWLLGEENSHIGTSHGQHSNSLGTVALHLSYLLNSEHPFNLSAVGPHPFYVSTVDEFDQMMSVLNSAKYVAVDTETRNLTVNQNTIYTIQLAPDNSKYGYVLALNHPKTPWNDQQITYFKKKLRAFFKQDKPTLVTMNGKFDLRVIRQYLKLPIISNSVWEITAGEHLLNEDMVTWSVLQLNKAHYGGLRAILCTYMNDFYFRNEFTKEDRDTAGDVKPSDPAFLRYAAMDVQCLLHIMKAQVKRASMLDIKGKSYKPFFIRHMLYEMSDTVHVLSHLDQDGSYIDVSYLKKLASSESPLLKQRDQIAQEINEFEETKKANAELLANAGFKSKGLFGNKTSSNWIFNLGKADHRIKLFLDVLGLKSVETTSKGEPSIGKAFIAQYKDTNEIVEKYGQYTEVNKIYNSYIKSWANLISSDVDCQHDGHLRPSYGFWGVATGRISSQNPSLQVIPQHGPSADAIKRMFIAPPGKLLIHYDYSAHEVRGWAIVSGDDNLADAFRAGQQLRKQWIKNPTEEVQNKLKREGDIHLQNVYRFFGKWVDKKDPLRQAVKGVVFGTLYSRSAQSLGEATKTADLQALLSQLNDAHHKSIHAETKSERVKASKLASELKAKVDALRMEDRTEYAQHIVDKMFQAFKNGAKWTHDMKDTAQKFGYVYSPLGRIRHLWSTIILNPKNKKLINRQIRRGSNAPIQGFASEIAVKAIRLNLQTFYKELPVLGKMLKLEGNAWTNRVECCRMVHDAGYFAVPYELVLPFIHISLYGSTYGIAQQLQQQFNLKCNIEPEIEYEIGTCDSDSGGTWNYTIPNLLQIIRQALQSAYDRGELEDVDATYNKVLRPWKNRQCRDYLCSKYPLLNVQDLQPVIIKAIKNEQNNGKR